MKVPAINRITLMIINNTYLLLTVLDSRALTVCGTCATVITQVNRLAQDTTIKTCPVDFAQSTKRSNILDGFNSR